MFVVRVSLYELLQSESISVNNRCVRPALFKFLFPIGPAPYVQSWWNANQLQANYLDSHMLITTEDGDHQAWCIMIAWYSKRC